MPAQFKSLFTRLRELPAWCACQRLPAAYRAERASVVCCGLSVARVSQAADCCEPLSERQGPRCASDARVFGEHGHRPLAAPAAEQSGARATAAAAAPAQGTSGRHCGGQPHSSRRVERAGAGTAAVAAAARWGRRAPFHAALQLHHGAWRRPRLRSRAQASPARRRCWARSG